MLSKTRMQALLQIARRKDRAGDGRFFVEGWRWLEEVLALDEPPACVLAIADAARSPAEQALLARARARAREFLEATSDQLGRLTDTVHPPGVAALVSWQPDGDASRLLGTLSGGRPGLVAALDAVGDPGNAGTIVRTADWFGVSGVIFGAGSAAPDNPKVVRSTMGSLFHLPIVAPGPLEPALAALRGAGFATVGAALDGTPLPEFRWPGRAVLVIGNEANGIGPETARALDHCVRIPAFGRAESLNAAVAAAVLLADWRLRGLSSNS